jgi:hypothetical protein
MSQNLEEEVSEILLKTSKFAIFSAQLAGYLPLSTTKKNSRKNLLQNSWLSIPTLSSFLGLFVIMGWTTLYYTVFILKIRFVKLFGPTEKFAYTLIVLVGSFVGIYLRIRALLVPTEVSEFFQENLRLLHNFQLKGLHISRMKEILKIQRYMSLSFLAYLVPLSLHCLLVHIYRPWSWYKVAGEWLPDIVYTIGSGFWVFWSYLLISNLWIILFPRIYSALYKEISKDVGEQFGNHKEKPILYMDEIFLRKPEKPEEKVKQYLELILELGRMIDKFNQVFGERLMFEMIQSIIFMLLYAFFACFWASRGEVRIIGEILTPLYVNGKKLIELGYSSGNISKEGQNAVKTLVDNVPFHELSEGTKRKVKRERKLLWRRILINCFFL